MDTQGSNGALSKNLVLRKSHAWRAKTMAAECFEKPHHSAQANFWQQKIVPNFLAMHYCSSTNLSSPHNIEESRTSTTPPVAESFQL